MSLRTRMLGAVVLAAAVSLAPPAEGHGHGGFHTGGLRPGGFHPHAVHPGGFHGGFHGGGFHHPGAFPGGHVHPGGFHGDHFHAGAFPGGRFGGFHGGFHGGYPGGFGLAHGGFGFGGFGFGGGGFGGWAHGGGHHHHQGHHRQGNNNGGGGGGGGGDGGGGYAGPSGYSTSTPTYPDPGEYNSFASDNAPAVAGPYNFIGGLTPQAAPAVDPAAAAAHLTVVVPPDAALWFNTVRKEETGAVRLFASPLLTPGEDYLYQVHARWSEGGQTIHRIRMVRVRANLQLKVDLTQAEPGDTTIR